MTTQQAKSILEYIDTQPAGRELDALVAEYVMGMVHKDADIFDADNISTRKTDRWENRDYTYSTKMGQEQSGRVYPELPHYSTNIAAAWQVVERLVELGYEVKSIRSDDVYWKNEVYLNKLVGGKDWECLSSKCESVELAICRAALRAVMK